MVTRSLPVAWALLAVCSLCSLLSAAAPAEASEHQQPPMETEEDMERLLRQIEFLKHSTEMVGDFNPTDPASQAVLKNARLKPLQTWEV